MNIIPKEVKNICCLGAGYVGTPTMAVIAEKCPQIKVTILDTNSEKIDAWNNKNFENLPVYEPGLSKILKKIRGINLFFSIDFERVIADADMIFISVNTPTKTKGFGAGYACDLKWVEASARQVAKFAKGNTIVVEKSTLPVRTAEVIKKILLDPSINCSLNSSKTFSILSNPEFLSEGTALRDLKFPDRVLIGGEDKKSIDQLTNIYLQWVPKEKILSTNLWSSELSKLIANAFLAQRISSINAASAICEATGADVKEVSNAIGFDQRIGSKFLSAGPGFGGSCFKKDILNLVYIAKHYGLSEVADYWEQVIKLNSWQTRRISQLIVEKLFGTVSLKKITILGFSFKSNTNDTRESPAIYIVNDLLENGASLNIHDPKVKPDQIEKELNLFDQYKKKEIEYGKWEFFDDVYAAVKNSDAVVILTDWPEYTLLDWGKIAKTMRKPAWLFDTRSITKSSESEIFGINYWSVGEGNL